jgi:hypothetical protein
MSNLLWPGDERAAAAFIQAPLARATGVLA